MNRKTITYFMIKINVLHLKRSSICNIVITIKEYASCIMINLPQQLLGYRSVQYMLLDLQNHQTIS